MGMLYIYMCCCVVFFCKTEPRMIIHHVGNPGNNIYRLGALKMSSKSQKTLRQGVHRAFTPVTDRGSTPCHFFTAVATAWSRRKAMITAVIQGRDDP